MFNNRHLFLNGRMPVTHGIRLVWKTCYNKQADSIFWKIILKRAMLPICYAEKKIWLHLPQDILLRMIRVPCLVIPAATAIYLHVSYGKPLEKKIMQLIPQPHYFIKPECIIPC